MILHHTGTPGDHYDFMLERGSVLLTWSLDSTDLSWPRLGTQKPDHRPLYLDFEGEVSGNRGRVKRVDQGTCEILKEDKRGLLVSLEGQTLTGKFLLCLFSNGPGEGATWGFIPWED